MFTITLDGPSASGKSTVADIVAEKLNIYHLNSGEFYRAIAYHMLNNGINITDTEKLNKELDKLNIEVKFIQGKQHLFLNNEDITEFLHTNPINEVVSAYARNVNVVNKSSDLTFLATKKYNLIIDGRNVGSYVIPNAECKIYLDCDPKIRAQRRYEEQLSKGFNVTLEEVYQQILKRDELDKTREIAPLVVPKNAYILSSDNKTVEEVAQDILNVVNSINKK